jgi:hypothetical protein
MPIGDEDDRLKGMLTATSLWGARQHNINLRALATPSSGLSLRAAMRKSSAHESARSDVVRCESPPGAAGDARVRPTAGAGASRWRIGSRDDRQARWVFLPARFVQGRKAWGCCPAVPWWLERRPMSLGLWLCLHVRRDPLATADI